MLCIPGRPRLTFWAQGAAASGRGLVGGGSPWRTRLRSGRAPRSRAHDGFNVIRSAAIFIPLSDWPFDVWRRQMGIEASAAAEFMRAQN